MPRRANMEELFGEMSDSDGERRKRKRPIKKKHAVKTSEPIKKKIIEEVSSDSDIEILEIVETKKRKKDENIPNKKKDSDNMRPRSSHPESGRNNDCSNIVINQPDAAAINRKKIEAKQDNINSRHLETLKTVTEENGRLKNRVKELEEVVEQSKGREEKRRKEERESRESLEAENRWLKEVTEKARKSIADAQYKEEKVRKETEEQIKSLKQEIDSLNGINFSLSSQLAAAERAAAAAADSESAAAAARKEADEAKSAAATYKEAAEKAEMAAAAARNALMESMMSAAKPAAASAAAADFAIREENTNLRASVDHLKTDRNYWKKEYDKMARELARFKKW